MAPREPLFVGPVPEGYREYLDPVIFGPWAEKLVDFAGVAEGQTVLDVAAGTGVVARAAASRAGPGGHVIASDISAAMLGQVATGLPAGRPAVQTLECPASELRLADGSVDVVFCQQGLQFVPDPRAAVQEMRRVLRPGGRVAIAVWLSSPRVEPFIVYGEVLEGVGLPEPFPGAYDTSRLSMSVEEVQGLLGGAGLVELEVTLARLGLGWPSPVHAARAIAGTPYGPVVAALDKPSQQEVMLEVQRRMTAPDGGAVRHVMTSVLARATKA
jgi:SAM-dependent methyltransferase